ncbi:MAG: MBL fold metallo-hydrolase [Spirochaetales bacterium]|nr:MBL fold metallo-hydrolase [Spirochaetales bacterium]
MPDRVQPVISAARPQETEAVRYAVLGSGSSANAYIFQYGDTAVAVDNGFSCKEFLRRAVAAGFDPGALKIILLTHVHGDHLRGVSTLSRALKIPVALHRDLPVPRFFPKGVHSSLPLTPEEPVTVGAVTILPFLSSHDAPCSMNYHLRLPGRSFTIITDTGVILPRMYELARQSNVLFLEANYSKTMLLNGPYPEDIKQRILSEQGHLSNDDAVHFLNDLYSCDEPDLEMVYFCHLSDTNNAPEVLKEHLRLHLVPDLHIRVCEKGELCLPPCQEGVGRSS